MRTQDTRLSRRQFVNHTGRSVAAAGLAAGAAQVYAPALIKAQTTTIRMMTPADLGLEREFYQSFIDDFQEAQPDINVELTFENWDDYHLKLPTLFAGGAVPDVVHQHMRVVQDYGHRNVFQDLAPLMARDGVDESSYIPKLLDAFSDDGVVYALPKDSGIRAVYYNKSMFDDAGLEYPRPNWTIDEFFTVAQELTVDEEGRRGSDPEFDMNSRKQQWGFSWVDPVPTNSGEDTLAFLWARGGRWYNDDYTETQLTDEPVMQHLMQFQDMRCNVGSSPSLAETAASESNQFALGLTAMIVENASMDFELRAEGAEFEWGITYVPAGPAGQFASTGSSGWAIPSGGDNIDAAWELVKYLTSAEVQQRIAEAHRWSPSNPDAADALAPDDPTDGYVMAHIDPIKGEGDVPLIAIKYPANQSRITQSYTEHFDPIWSCDADDVQAAAEATKPEVDAILTET